MKVVRLSALCTDRLYSPENIPGTHFCWRLSRSQGHSAAGRIMSMKNSNGTIGNRTRDLLACGTVPHLVSLWLTQCLIKVRTTSEKNTASEISQTFYSSVKALLTVNTTNYLAINERAAGNANLHAHMHNSHHIWVDCKDSET